MNPIERFRRERAARIRSLGKDRKFRNEGLRFMVDSIPRRYSFNFDWLGRPIIQYPQDIVAIQELIWRVKPELIIETGVAHGGSLILSASILELIGGKGKVVGIDIDIRKHNRREIERHRMFKRIVLIEGSSTDGAVAQRVRKLARGRKPIMVFLDSSHSHDHVLKELELYAPLVHKGSYCVVFDTIIKDIPERFYGPRPWDRKRNPATAVKAFLNKNKDFSIDRDIENKLLITVAPGGYLCRVT